ncbi:MAG: hypothetical protein J0H42_22830 [Rhizobiales bacterium]|nr:hypothetical protein [Hyphomicrobiales bacterium]
MNCPPPTNKLKFNWYAKFSERTEMAPHLFRSGYEVLQYEIAEERASALARLGQRLEDALTALAAYPPTADFDRKIRNRLVEQAGYALWMFVVQRESVGLNKIDHVIQIYRVPKEVLARMGPLPKASIEPTKPRAVAEARAPLF